MRRDGGRWSRKRWVHLVAASFALFAVPAFAVDTTEEWDPELTDWEYYFTYDEQNSEKTSEFVIGAGTGIGQTLSIGLIGALDHNDTECGVLTALGARAFYRIPQITERYGVDFDVMADFGWEETSASSPLTSP